MFALSLVMTVLGYPQGKVMKLPLEMDESVKGLSLTWGGNNLAQSPN